jgi:hypothetical protein
LASPSASGQDNTPHSTPHAATHHTTPHAATHHITPPQHTPTAPVKLRSLTLAAGAQAKEHRLSHAEKRSERNRNESGLKLAPHRTSAPKKEHEERKKNRKTEKQKNRKTEEDEKKKRLSPLQRVWNQQQQR